MFTPPIEAVERNYHIENLIMNDDDLLLPSEQYFAKMTLKQIMIQISFKNKFKNSLIMRYESLKNSLQDEIQSLEENFQIKSNMEQITKTSQKKSYSSMDTMNDLSTIRDPQANAMITTACRLWNYNINN